MSDENANMPENIDKNPSKPPKQTRSFSVADVLKDAQLLLSLLVGLTAVLTGGGFLVVNSYLGQFTDIHGYSIAPEQYLSAGVDLLIAVSLVAIPAAIFSSLDFRSLAALLRRLGRRTADDSQRKAPDTLLRASLRRLSSVVYSWQVISITSLAYGIFAAFVYGPQIYGNIPHALGGGKPATEILVLKDTVSPQIFDLSVDPVNPRRTSTVLLLADLTDGVLVADTTTGHVASIKGDLIVGIIDNDIAANLVTATATDVRTPAPTTTLTSTAEP